jgi:hypothetical protein
VIIANNYRGTASQAMNCFDELANPRDFWVINQSASKPVFKSRNFFSMTLVLRSLDASRLAGL